MPSCDTNLMTKVKVDYLDSSFFTFHLWWISLGFHMWYWWEKAGQLTQVLCVCIFAAWRPIVHFFFLIVRMYWIKLNWANVILYVRWGVEAASSIRLRQTVPVTTNTNIPRKMTSLLNVQWVGQWTQTTLAHWPTCLCGLSVCSAPTPRLSLCPHHQSTLISSDDTFITMFESTAEMTLLCDSLSSLVLSIATVRFPSGLCSWRKADGITAGHQKPCTFLMCVLYMSQGGEF